MPEDESVNPAPLTVAIRGRLNSLQPAMARVGSYILEHVHSVALMTITDLAAACDTSETTVVRFCREVGVNGYPQLRLTLAAENGMRVGSAAEADLSGDIDTHDTLEDVVRKIAFTDSQAVAETASALSIPELEAAVAAMAEAGRVDIYGAGASGLVAADLGQKLHRIGRVAFAFPDADTQVVSAALLGPRDVALGISHTGMTLDTIEALRLAHSRGAVTVAITNDPASHIVEHADRVLLTAARETALRSGATASRLAQLLVVDCLFVGVAQRSYAQSMRALEDTRDAIAVRRATPGRRRSK